MEPIQIVSSSISPKDFFEEFVKLRRPVAFSGQFNDTSWKADKWSMNYLKEKAGNDTVQVEVKQGNSFGKGSSESIKFASFIERVQSGDNTLYLSTQELPYSLDDMPALVSTPVSSLVTDIPACPAIVGGLVPQNVNLWIGYSREETSSGLHHDYHDNVYILLQGRKRFILFPPETACSLYTYGEIDFIHPNGRICYKGQQRTCADGSAQSSVQAMQASLRVDAAAERLEKLINSSANACEVDDDESDEVNAEEALEAALEQLLDAEMAAGGGDDELDSDESDDADEDNVDIFIALSSTGKRSLDQDKVNSSPVIAKRSLRVAVDAQLLSPANSLPSSSQYPPHQKLPEHLQQSRLNHPLNFSRVRESELSPADIQNLYPLYPPARQSAVEVVVEAGQMLYIPTGWFHEVYSISTNGSCTAGVSTSKVTDCVTSRDGIKPTDVHMALNYWFHPPDGDSFERPYKSDFWPLDWHRRGKQLV